MIKQHYHLGGRGQSHHKLLQVIKKVRSENVVVSYCERRNINIDTTEYNKSVSKYFLG